MTAMLMITNRRMGEEHTKTFFDFIALFSASIVETLEVGRNG